MLLRIRTGMEEDEGVGEIDEATLKWWGRRLSSGKQTSTGKQQKVCGKEHLIITHDDI